MNENSEPDLIISYLPNFTSVSQPMWSTRILEANMEIVVKIWGCVDFINVCVYIQGEVKKLSMPEATLSLCYSRPWMIFPSTIASYHCDPTWKWHSHYKELRLLSGREAKMKCLKSLKMKSNMYKQSSNHCVYAGGSCALQTSYFVTAWFTYTEWV